MTLGSRPDRLAAYAGRLPATYPHGVPADEAAVALDLLRADRAASLGLRPAAAYGPAVIPAPAPVPHAVWFAPFTSAAPWRPAVRGAGFVPTATHLPVSPAGRIPAAGPARP